MGIEWLSRCCVQIESAIAGRSQDKADWCIRVGSRSLTEGLKSEVRRCGRLGSKEHGNTLPLAWTSQAAEDRDFELVWMLS